VHNIAGRRTIAPIGLVTGIDRRMQPSIDESKYDTRNNNTPLAMQKTVY
jgi:hypothetical protein